MNHIYSIFQFEFSIILLAMICLIQSWQHIKYDISSVDGGCIAMLSHNSHLFNLKLSTQWQAVLNSNVKPWIIFTQSEVTIDFKLLLTAYS